MTMLDAAWLGALQGLTEFLPVSSSGHLVIFGEAPPLLFDILVHFGTLLAAVFYLRRDVWSALAGIGRALRQPRNAAKLFRDDEWTRVGVLVAIGTLPTVAIGLGFESILKPLFDEPRKAAGALLATAALLFVTDWLLRKDREEAPQGDTPWWVALAVGAAQGLAIIPGVSRSGATMCSGLILGLSRDFAFRFAFLLMIPAVLGATIYEVKDATIADWDPAYGVGVVVSMLTGLLALVLLRFAVRRGRLWGFGVYCLGVAIWGLIVT